MIRKAFELEAEIPLTKSRFQFVKVSVFVDPFSLMNRFECYELKSVA
jgi:hypothetical protein